MTLLRTESSTPVELTKNRMVSNETSVGRNDFGNSYTARLLPNAARAMR